MHTILVFTESWLKPQVSNDSRMIDSCAPPHRTDRHGRPGGGVADFYLHDFFLNMQAQGRRKNTARSCLVGTSSHNLNRFWSVVSTGPLTAVLSTST